MTTKTIKNHSPILFSTEMVKALLAGRKTQTRRLVKFTALQCLEGGFTPEYVAEPGNHLWNPYGQPGNILWVRESWTWEGATKYTDAQPVGSFYYKADADPYGPHKWKPSIHMPRIACRMHLRVTAIHIERVQDITPEDCVKEGVLVKVAPSNVKGFVNPIFKAGENNALSFMPEGWQELQEKEKMNELLRAHYAELICKINGANTWRENPYVWVIDFEKI